MAKEVAKQAGRRLPPYISHKTFSGFMERLKSEPPLPSRIDRSYWGSSYSGSVGVQLVTALRFLDLINEENIPTKKLERLVGSVGTQQKEELRRLFLEAYSPVLGNLELSRATPAQLNEQLKNYGAVESVRRKIQRFLIAMAQDAGLQVSPSILKRKKGSKKVTREKKQEVKPQQAPPTSISAVGIHPAISGFLQELPFREKRWTEGERQRWIDAFVALIKALYPSENDK